MIVIMPKASDLHYALALGTANIGAPRALTAGNAMLFVRVVVGLFITRVVSVGTYMPFK